MKRKLLILALLTATNVFANGTQADATAGAAAVSQSQAIGAADARAQVYNQVGSAGYAVGNSNGAYNSGYSVSQGGAGGRGEAGVLFSGNSSSGGNSQEVNIGGVPAQQTITNNGRVQIANVPNVYLPTAIPTATCMNGISFGGSAVGGGGGLGFGWEMTNCRKQELARQFEAMGLREDALAILCSADHTDIAPSCAKRKPAAAPAKTAEWAGGTNQ